MRETVFIGFGSNVGDRIDFCDRAVTLLSLLPHSRLHGVSLLYETEPVRDRIDPGEGWFLNGVVQLETDIAPRSLLTILQEIERSLGRDDDNRSGPRTIDLGHPFLWRTRDQGTRVDHSASSSSSTPICPHADE